MDFIKQLINGLGIGSIYALVALGYTMVYGIVKLINFAHGDIIMVGSYFVFYFTSILKLPFYISIPLSVVICAIFGVVIEKIAYKPLRDSPKITSLITAIGVSIFLQNLFMLIFKADPKPFKTIFEGSLKLGTLSISYTTLANIIISILLMICLSLFISKTKLGKAMRAVSEDSGAAILMGINVDFTISMTFAIGSALAAIGGTLYSNTYPVINPFMGSMFGIKAFIAAVLGGIGIIPGAMLGGFILGIIETFTKAVNSQLADTVVFSILILVLLIKPSGLLGKNSKEKV